MGIRSSLRARVSEPGAVVSAASTRLDVNMLYRDQTQWCWAACAVMIFQFHFRPLAGLQCQDATDLFAPEDCCQHPSSSACNKPCPVGQFSGVLARRGLTVPPNTPRGPITFNELQLEIVDQERPVPVVWAWTSGGSHMVVVVDAYLEGGKEMVWILDPDPQNGGEGFLSFADLERKPGRQWTHTWTGITR